MLEHGAGKIGLFFQPQNILRLQCHKPGSGTGEKSVQRVDRAVVIADDMIEGGHIAEVQATAEGATYDEEQLLRLLRLARTGCDEIFKAQAAAVSA